jgi:hypothetical protein
MSKLFLNVFFGVRFVAGYGFGFGFGFGFGSGSNQFPVPVSVQNLVN